MKTPLKLGGYVAALALSAAVAFGVGNAVGPVAAETSTHNSNGEDMTNPHAQHGAGESENAGAHAAPGGLQVSSDGYTLQLDHAIRNEGSQKVAFQVTGPGGGPVTSFDPTHEKELHFIAVRRDTTGFQHVHPVMDTSGTWTTDLDLTAGDWRFFADFAPAGAGEAMTLGIDVAVGGHYAPQPLPEQTRTAQVDEYTVTLDGDLVPGESGELTLTVSRDGKPVTDLQPYLAAYGHLVALRVGDLGYLHVHPDGEPGDGTTTPGPEITFAATAPSAGPYRLFLDFQHDGVVRTAEFTLNTVGSNPPVNEKPSDASGAGSDDGHGGHG